MAFVFHDLNLELIEIYFYIIFFHLLLPSSYHLHQPSTYNNIYFYQHIIVFVLVLCINKFQMIYICCSMYQFSFSLFLWNQLNWIIWFDFILCLFVCLFNSVHKNSRSAVNIEYGLKSSGSVKSTSSGDRRLAQSAQMYHYQHQKQQMIAMEK